MTTRSPYSARTALLAASPLLLAVALTACTPTGSDSPEPTSPVVQLGAPGESNRTLSPDEAANLGSPEFSEVDSAFMLAMIRHHQQAIEMTDLVDDRTDDRDIRLLAERMSVSQQDEKTQITTWLQERSVPVNGDGSGHEAHDAESMPGMLSDDQFAELEAATGEEFDLLFLEYMIQHHEGAVQMVDDLYADGGGQESATDQFARHVESDQGIEIARMQQMLAERTG
ncbi:DUF305 domain-containing protein [Agromyces sp. NPDC127015]|uniref:DUF305 domain-containing protein n=1 Tax=Agromyces sp. NPDC127015 TaxID=3347108 RepID=UPI00365B08E9